MHRMIRLFATTGLIAALISGCGGGGDDESNRCGVVFTDQQSALDSVVINEILAKPEGTSKDWIELYNTSSAAVDVGCWSVKDQGAKNAAFFIADGTILEPGGFLVLHKDRTGAAGFRWGFSSKGDKAFLFDPEGKIADSTTFAAGEAQAGNSWGRYPDGSGDFATLLPPTEGAANAEPDPNPPSPPPAGGA